jgi:hypothetical protein
VRAVWRRWRKARGARPEDLAIPVETADLARQPRVPRPAPSPIRSSQQRRHFTVSADPVRLRLSCIPTVVTALGGGYFFLLSLGALARIAAGS